jgi:hypothetical protein
MLTLVLGVFALGWAVAAYVMQQVSAFLALLGVSLVILALMFFMMAVIMQQGWMIQKELWTLQGMVSRDEAERLRVSGNRSARKPAPTNGES